MLTSIPPWNVQGVIDPIDFANPPSAIRSPYIVSLETVVRHFSTSPERIQILDGLLRYRDALHTAGIEQGFQWLNGSFLENKEQNQGAPPNDIDVLTLFVPPSGISLNELFARDPVIFGRARNAVKAKFLVDGFLVQFGQNPTSLMENACYFFSLFSHKKTTYQWKGILQVDLSSGEDAAANAAMPSLLGGATP